MEKERVTQERKFCFSQIFMKLRLITECTDKINFKMCVIAKSEKITQMRSLRYAFFSFFVRSSTISLWIIFHVTENSKI
jgi:hypothetical protein